MPLHAVPRSLLLGAPLSAAATAATLHLTGWPWWVADGAAIALATLLGALAWRARARARSAELRGIAAMVLAAAEGRRQLPPHGSPDVEISALGKAVDEAFRAIGAQRAELQRDRARSAAILSGMVEGVLVVNAAGRLDLMNDAVRHMLGLPSTALGRPFTEAIRHPELVAQIASALGGQIPVGVELSLEVGSGQVFVARTAPVGAGTEGGAVLVLHDITDLRRADRVRRDFVANVSHELRTPLTAIRGYVEALLEAPDPEDTERFLQVVARHARRMESLVKDLLRLARLDAGQEVLDRVTCSVEQVWNGVLTELAPALEARRQRVDTVIAPGAEAVTGDPGKLHDIFRNLVENASNYSPEGSTITLQASADRGGVLLRVLDEGPGIPDADLERIFERFYRVDRARSRETGGTGLGLSIVKHLVELHRGDVMAGNRGARGGAVFTIRLPRAR